MQLFVILKLFVLSQIKIFQVELALKDLAIYLPTVLLLHCMFM